MKRFLAVVRALLAVCAGVAVIVGFIILDEQVATLEARCGLLDARIAEFEAIEGRVRTIEAQVGAGGVTTHRVQVIDENGEPRVELDGSGAAVRVSDEKGADRIAILATSDGGAAVVVVDENGKHRAILGVTDSGAVMVISDEKGEPRVDLNDSGTVRVSDGKGKLRAVLGTTEIVFPNGTEHKHPESTLTLFGSDGKVLRQLP